MQMALADRMVRAKHRALHEAETAFCGVDMQEAAKPHVFVGAVVDSAVAGEFVADPWVDKAFVGHQVAGAIDLRNDNRTQRRGAHIARRGGRCRGARDGRGGTPQRDCTRAVQCGEPFW